MPNWSFRIFPKTHNPIHNWEMSEQINGRLKRIKQGVKREEHLKHQK